MYEFLKKLFGTTESGEPEALTYEQLEAKLSAAKDVKIVNLADGGYVSKDKFEAQETKAKGLEQQLTDANKEIQSYKDMDIDAIKQSAKEWEKKHADDTKALQEQLKAQERSHAEDMFFADYKFTSKAAKAGVRAEFAKQEFKLNDSGEFVGAKEWMDKLSKEADYQAAFAVEHDPAPSGEPAGQQQQKKPHFADPAPNSGNQKPEKKVSLTELMKQKNENPNAEIKYE